MSKIVGFRGKIIEELKTKVPDLKEVDWWDGLFDHTDISEWALKTPAAFVSVTNVPTSHATTGELSTDLKCVIAVIEQDRRSPRDADEKVWDLLEQIAVLVNFNSFGDDNAAPGCDVKFKRLRDPELRREGVAVGVIEWNSGLTIGNNRARDRDLVMFNGQRVTQMPTSLVGRGVVHDRNHTSPRQDMVLDGDGYTGSSSLDRGVAEVPLVPGQDWEPDL